MGDCDLPSGARRSPCFIGIERDGRDRVVEAVWPVRFCEMAVLRTATSKQDDCPAGDSHGRYCTADHCQSLRGWRDGGAAVARQAHLGRATLRVAQRECNAILAMAAADAEH